MLNLDSKRLFWWLFTRVKGTLENDNPLVKMLTMTYFLEPDSSTGELVIEHVCGE